VIKLRFDAQFIEHAGAAWESAFDLIRWMVELQTVGVRMGAKFEVFKGKDGDFRFRLKAANGKVVAHGQGYKSKDACLKGVESIKKNARGAAVVQTDS